MSRLPLGFGPKSPRATWSEEQPHEDSSIARPNGWDELALQEAASSPFSRAPPDTVQAPTNRVSFHSLDVDMGRGQVSTTLLPQQALGFVSSRSRSKDTSPTIGQALMSFSRNSSKTSPKQVSDSVSVGTLEAALAQVSLVSPALSVRSLDLGSVASLPPKARSVSRSRQSSPQATPTPHTRSSNESNQASAASVAEEADSESPPAPLSAKPQQVVINGEVKHFWSEHWGVTIDQVRDLINTSRKDPRWKQSNTMRDLVRDYIKPATAGQGVGYALLINREQPLEVNVMVSHSWRENAEEFCESLERTVRQDDVLFICALSLFQNEDGSGPSIEDQLGGAAENSPFYRALKHIRDQNERLNSKGGWLFTWVDVIPSLLLSVGLLLYALPIFAKGCLPSLEYCYCPLGGAKAHHGQQPMGLMYDTTPMPLSSSFRPFVLSGVTLVLTTPLVWLYAKCRTSARPGYLLAVPNRQDDLYQRLWCVYEIFVAATLGVPFALANTLALAGTCSSLEATCSCDSDMDSIREEIKDWGRRQFGDDGHSGFVVVDRKIREVTYSGHWTTFLMMVRSMTPLAVLCMICTQLELKSAKAMAGPAVAANICGTSMGWAYLVTVVFFRVQRCQGRVPLRQLLLMMVVLLSPSVIFILWKSAAKLNPEHSAGAIFVKKFGYAPFIGSELIAAYLFAAQLSACLKCGKKSRRFLAGVLLVAPVIYNVGKGVQGAGVPASFYDDGLPWVVFIMSRLGYYAGILIFGIWAFTRWGVCIDPTQPVCGCSGGCERSLKRLRSSTSISSDPAIQAPTARFSNREGAV